MKDLLKHFRTDLAQTVLNFVWSAWSQVGIMGGSIPSQPRVIDPEPLLLLTWECARQDPRAFDEVLDWLVENGRWINVVRLTALLEKDHICPATVVGAVAALMASQDKTLKWRNLAQRYQPRSGTELRGFFQRHGKPLTPAGGGRDEIFAGYGWRRSRYALRGQSQPIPTWSPASLVFKCRAFFGICIRADVFAYLTARGPGTASGMARELGFSQRRVQETLTEMQLAGPFQTRYDGNRKEFSMDPRKGWQLLFEETPERAQWFNWRAYGRAVSTIWRTAFLLKEEGLTAYLFESEMAKTLKTALPDCTAFGLTLSNRPTTTEFLEKLKRL